jgi:hypothetical protein
MNLHCTPLSAAKFTSLASLLWNAVCSSLRTLLAPTKFVALSLNIVSGNPRLPMNLLKTFKKASVDKSVTKSK